MLELIEIDVNNRKDVIDLITENWGSPIIVSNKKVHSAENLSGYIAIENGKLRGVVTYCIENNECEIVSLDSLTENQGIGTKLIDKVIEKAIEDRCYRVWLITTNDNTKALRFYQKRGFELVAFRRNAILESRKIKPQIPMFGFDGIPILHEIEFEKAL